MRKSIYLHMIWAALMLGGVVIDAIGSVTAHADDKERHNFGIEVDKSAGTVSNVHYLYGELGWRERAAASPGGAFATVGYVATLPDEFEISWYTKSNIYYHFKIPVRAQIKAEIKDKTVLFVIMDDHVEGFIVTHLQNYHSERERFY